MAYNHSVTKQQLNEMLHKGVVKLVFRKKSDNSLRTMLATCHPSSMPEPPKNPDGTVKVSSRPLPERHVLVWDTEANGLRSLDMDTMTEPPELVYQLDLG